MLNLAVQSFKGWYLLAARLDEGKKLLYFCFNPYKGLLDIVYQWLYSGGRKVEGIYISDHVTETSICI